MRYSFAKLFSVAAASSILGLLALSGCGSGDSPSGPGKDERDERIGGTLKVALSMRPASLDPLTAHSRDALSAVRQIVEPLVLDVDAPEGRGRRQDALLSELRPTADGRVWWVTLREGVVFSDGTPLNARAVEANFERWRTTREGARLLPGLRRAVPKSGRRLRIAFDRPARFLAERLRDPRLGVVSPGSLRPAGGRRARLKRSDRVVGTGPFVLESNDRRQLVVSRFARWWGTADGLGPSLDRVVFLEERGSTERAAQLEAHSVDIATSLPASAADRLTEKPNIVVVRSAGSHANLGYWRNIHGIGVSNGSLGPLNSAWFTNTLRP